MTPQFGYRLLPASEKISRRGFLKLGAVATIAGVCARVSWAAGSDWAAPERALAFRHAHTGESLKTVYWAEGDYLPEALAEIDRLLRDFRTGEIKPIDPALLDLLYALGGKLGGRRAFHVISGYRSPQTNAFLRSQGRDVAAHSLHMEGKAIDIRLPGSDLSRVRRAALALQRGGVGYYPRSQFVHVDVGRVRVW